MIRDKSQIKQDRILIKQHFKQRLIQRYQIKVNDVETLQNSFIKRLSFMNIDRYKTRVLKQYDKNKLLYITTFKGKRVKFIYDSYIQLCKTVI